MDFVDLVYPTGNKNSDSHISNVEDFIEQIKNDMRMRQISSRKLFYEMKQGREPRRGEELDNKNIGELSKGEFKRAVNKKGLRLPEKLFFKLFMTLDHDKDGVISYTDFREAAISQAEDNQLLVNKVRLEFEHFNLSISKIFEHLKIRDKRLT